MHGVCFEKSVIPLFSAVFSMAVPVMKKALRLGNRRIILFFVDEFSKIILNELYLFQTNALDVVKKIV